MTKFILNADDMGLTKNHNRAVLKGYETGILSGASFIVNCEEAFQDALVNVIPRCPDLNIGIHLNIMEGKALSPCDLLTDNNGNFNRGYLYFIFNQYNKKLQKQIENEFRAQIEKALSTGIKFNHIDSHVHTHAIPELFKITCKLAGEYNIKYVRTQFEAPYLVFPECLSLKFAINLLKVALLDTFTLINRPILKKYYLKTNDNILGVGYTGMMNSKTVCEGIKNLKSDLVEILIHPCVYDDDRKNSHTEEFLITQDKFLKAKFLNNT